MRTGERGFTYLWLLFVVAIGGAGLGVAASAWKTQSQREKEKELLFRGGEIERAIASYRSASAAGPAQWPRDFDDLLEDRRGGIVRRHLRRLYADPFTGKPDWERLGAEQSELRGVKSRGRAIALLIQEFGPPADLSQPVRVSDKVFGMASIAPPAPSASAAAGMPVVR
jgi:type II secretory pathway pseudopilin PulG